MLKKKERLTKKEFDHFFRIGCRYNSPSIQLIHTATDKKFHGAVVVGKKVYKHAVDRNRLRRRLYAVLYDEKIKKLFLTGVYIVITKPTAKTTSISIVREELRNLIGKTVK